MAASAAVAAARTRGAFSMGRVTDIPDQVVMPPLVFLGQEALSPDPQIRLWAAARSGDMAALLKALAEGADVNALDTGKTRSGRRALNWAAIFDHTDVIKLLLQHGARIDAVNRTGFTAIHHAAENGSLDTARVLLQAGADATVANRRGELPAATAARHGHVEVAKLLENN